jgi:TonB family protein
LGGKPTRDPHVFPGHLGEQQPVSHVKHSSLNLVKLCYERGLAKHPELGGRVAVRFTISAEGKVIAAAVASSTMKNPEVESCIVNAVLRWEFPPPSGGGEVIVEYPFSFSPATAE